MFIVLGLGVIGSAAAYQLASRGHKVLAFDANPKGHIQGSSHGRSRITRQAYFEAPEYVPLAQQSQALWRELETKTARTLYSQIGALFVGDESSDLVQGSLKSARQHDLPHELLSGSATNKRFPAFHVPAEALALLEPNAGILHADQCLLALQDAAQTFGAELHFGEPVTGWTAHGQSITVTTRSGQSYNADGLVIAAGPWTPQVLPELHLPLSVKRMLCVHFNTEDHPRFSQQNLPVWCLQFDNQFLYGFPSLAGQGLKVGRHDDGEPCTPETARRAITDAEVAAIQKATNKYLPGAALSVKEPVTCLYTNTPDENFILDRHPQHHNVVYMTGCSGHSFKFGPSIGQALADLVSNGATDLPVAFLSASRDLLKDS